MRNHAHSQEILDPKTVLLGNLNFSAALLGTSVLTEMMTPMTVKLKVVSNNINDVTKLEAFKPLVEP